MIAKNIDQISEEDLQALIDNSVLEGKTIEYKQSLPGNSDSDKKEFLADISSFANASGGDLIYGILEDR
ncbi:ATP-binding protein, partial [bacterium]|nr:ATP-binding protein [bacterium]